MAPMPFTLETLLQWTHDSFFLPRHGTNSRLSFVYVLRPRNRAQYLLVFIKKVATSFSVKSGCRSDPKIKPTGPCADKLSHPTVSLEVEGGELLFAAYARGDILSPRLKCFVTASTT